MAGGKKTKSKARLDKYYFLAKEHGFRSRAAFKLIQLNKKYRFLENSSVLIDLCAAPGGWLQVAAKYMPVSSIKIGVDLDPIKSINGVTTFQADITSEKCRFLIKKEIKHFKADIVLNDGAPNVGGTWAKDAYNQSELVLFALKLGTEFLKEKGMFITKIFRSSDYNALIYVLKQLFEKVDATKPAASRNESAEIFVVCQGYKAPSYIDPKLLDPKFALNQVENEEDMKLNSINSIKAMFDIKKSRGGYFTSSLYNQKSLKEFVECPNPYQFLYENNKIKVLTEDCKKYLSCCKCPEDYEIIMEDIKVLGKKEIRDLIIWRQKIRTKSFKEKKSDKEEVKGEETTYEEVKMNEIDNEIEALDKERKKRVAHEKRKKEKHDLKQKMSFISQNETSANDGVDYDEDLFEYLRKENIDIEALPDHSKEKKKKAKKESDPDEEIDLSNISEDDYIDMLNNDVEDNMDMFNDERKTAQSNKKITNKMNKKIKKQERMERKAQEEELETLKNEKEEGIDKEDNDKEDIDKEDKELDDGSDIFDDDSDDDDDDFNDNPLRNLNNKNKNKMIKKTDEDNEKETKAQTPINEENQLSDDTDEEIETSKKRKKLNDQNEFQEVLAKKEEEDYDTDDKAEIRAIAKKMLRKKSRLSIFQRSYNRYAFDDLDIAPKWFVDDENQHNKPMKPVTKDEIMREKEELREVNSKMPKKILEAKNRKKRKIAKKMQKVKKIAENIVNQEEINEKSKIQQIEKLYRKELSKFKVKKKYVVSRKYKQDAGSQRKGGRNVKFVDRRMKKEGRAEKRKIKAGKGKRGGKTGGKPEGRTGGKKGGKKGGSKGGSKGGKKN